MAGNNKKYNTTNTNSPRKKGGAKALCCTARTSSPDAGPPQVPIFRPHQQLPSTNGLSGHDWPSLTPSDVLELRDTVPVSCISDDVERSDAATTSSKSTTRASVVQLLKKKLSRTSTTFKPLRTKHVSPSKPSPSKRCSTKKSNLNIISPDPLEMSFDPDARQIVSPDINQNLLEDAETDAETPERPAHEGTSTNEKSKSLLAAPSEQHLSSGPSAAATTNVSTAEETETNPLSEGAATALDDEQLSSQHSHATEFSLAGAPAVVYIRVEPPTDVLLGKLSFEDTIEVPKARSVSRMSEIALAVDRCFSSSSEYSERILNTMEASMSAQDHKADEVYRAPYTNDRLDVEIPRRQPSDASVHLQHMRISQHLRSLSTLSFDSDTLSDHHRTSSGFESVKVPSSWGKVIGWPGASSEEQSSENVRSTFPTATVVNEDCKLKSDQTQGRRDPQSLNMNVDGPVDQNSQGERSSSLAPPASSTSIGNNYDETTAMWERALTAHQEDRLNPSRTRGSSFSNLSRRSSQREKASIEAQRKDSAVTTGLQDASQIGETPVMLKRVNTTLSFDRIQMPIARTGSISRPVSLTDNQNTSRRASRRLTVDGRQRSVSSPGPYDVGAATTDDGPHSRLLVPGGADFGVMIPNITLSKPTREDSSSLAPSSIVGPFDHLPSSERPWARYPSEDREIRNGPASAATGDDVIVRDFQPYTSESPHPVTKMDRLRRKEKAKLRATTVIVKRKLMTDLPSVFRSNATFRRREHGHRTSITTGGILEYPELELLPPSMQYLPTSLDTSHDITDSRRKATSSARNTPSKQRVSASPTMAASHAGSVQDQEPAVQHSNAMSVKKGSSILAKSYQKHIQPDLRKGSESVSPLDGEDDTN